MTNPAPAGTFGTDGWPVLTRYDEGHLDRISLPIGGIGTGTIGLGGRGDLRDFEIGNRPAKGFRPRTAFFALRIASEGSPPVARVLEGPLGDGDFEGAEGSRAANHGLPRFRSAEFDAAYPFGQVRLSDPDLPPTTLRGFNPLIPGDVEASSWPLAVYAIDVANTTSGPMLVSVAAALENLIGENGTDDLTGDNTNRLETAPGLVGIRMLAPTLDSSAEAYGEFVLSTIVGDGASASTRTAWAEGSWGNPLLDFWDDFVDDGALDERPSGAARPIASVTNSVTIAPGATHTFTFLMTWSFPNRVAWLSEDIGGANFAQYTTDIVGNHYSVAHPDPWQTAVDAVGALASLEARTIDAVSSIVASSVPAVIREAALYNVSTLRSATVFRTRNGRFYGWEGVQDRVGSCFGTCNHVWGYEFATSFWFAEIAWSFRDTQYALATNDDGLMSFRVGLPVEDAQQWPYAAADGQMATLVHLYLDWRLSGDDAALARLWPAARRSLEFAWIPGGWDADQDGVMEGCQHNTMDVEYYGPNPQMGSWYLAALKASAEMAKAVGEDEFAATCERLFASGSAWLDDSLFTGSYYRHEIRPTAKGELIAEGIRHRSMGTATPDHPDLQLGDGVLVDQLVGQYASRLVGLGPVLDDEHVRTTLRTIFERNFRSDFRTHFNNMRGYVLGDEAGLLMCSYEDGKRPPRPFPYFNEVMTGFEYTAATGMIQDGNRDDAVTVIAAIRARYNGRRRNPFDEAECGHHYARAMASWSAFVAWNGFSYDARSASMRFAPVGFAPVGFAPVGFAPASAAAVSAASTSIGSASTAAASSVSTSIAPDSATGSTFWSTGSAWGVWSQSAGNGTLEVRGGSLPIATVVIDGKAVALEGDVHRSAGWAASVALG